MQFIDRNGEKFKPLSDIRVRRALSHAIRRNEIAKALFGKSGQGNDMGSSKMKYADIMCESTRIY